MVDNSPAAVQRAADKVRLREAQRSNVFQPATQTVANRAMAGKGYPQAD